MREETSIPLVFKLLSALTLTILLTPVVIVVLSGLNSGDYLTFPPQGLSLRWVYAFLTSPTFLSAYGGSFRSPAFRRLFPPVLGTMAALFLTPLVKPCGRPDARLLHDADRAARRRTRPRALRLLYHHRYRLARSMAGLVIGHVIVTCPFVIATVTAALVGFDRSLEEAARSLGASPFTAFRLVTLKIISPAISAGTIFAFIISFGQFEVTLFLSTPTCKRCRWPCTWHYATPSSPQQPPPASSPSSSSSSRWWRPRNSSI